MYAFIKRVWPYLVVNIIGFYLLPLCMNNTGSAMLVLLLVNPILVFCTAYSYGNKYHKFDVLYPLLIGLFFIPVIYIYMNFSALYLVVIYIVMAMIGLFIGKLINKKQGTPA